MRIIAGYLKGRRLPSPIATTRPTSDRAREMLFNVMTHGDEKLPNEGFASARVLDVFAGTGSFAFEALSRGAQTIGMIENQPEALRNLRTFAQSLCPTLPPDHAIHIFGFSALMPLPASAPFTLVFLDPPYGRDMLMPSIQALDRHGWIAPDAQIIAEVSAREMATASEAPLISLGLRLTSTRSCGAAQFLFLRRDGPHNAT